MIGFRKSDTKIEKIVYTYRFLSGFKCLLTFLFIGQDMESDVWMLLIVSCFMGGLLLVPLPIRRTLTAYYELCRREFK